MPRSGRQRPPAAAGRRRGDDRRRPSPRGTDPLTGSNADLAGLLEELAAILRVRKAERFRVRAYERAARLVRRAPVEVTSLGDSELRRLEGVGGAIAGVISEYGATGTIRLLDELRATEPPGFGQLLTLPLIGVRDARALAGVHGFTGLASLRRAAQEGGLAGLDPRLAHRVRESLRRVDATALDGTPLPRAARESEAMAEALLELPGMRRVDVAGAVRRGRDTVDDLALVLVCDAPAEVRETLPSHRAVVRLLSASTSSVQVLAPAGSRARLWLTRPPDAGAALLHATGPSEHAEALRRRAAGAGLDLRVDGVWRRAAQVAGAAEADIYAALGLPELPPELRERDDLTAPVPGLVRLGDVRGDLHVHSDWSGDGVDPLEAMVEECLTRGYEYVALTDHAENLRINGMPREALRARRRTISELRRRHPYIRVLDAAELNISLDGGLDYDLEFLLGFDLTVASVHSDMERGAAEQTNRILAAIEHPAVDVIGHPTGRILGRRPSYEIELTAIAQAAAETGTALEVNGSPARLDLSGDMIRTALSAGAMLSLASDAHSVDELDYMRHAVRTGRHGWATPQRILNCLPAGELLAAADARRGR